MDGMACVWDAKTGERRITLRGMPGSAIRWSFSPDGSRVVIAGHDPSARVFELKTGREKLAIRYPGPAQGGVFSSVAFNPDRSRIVTTKRNERPVVWDASSGRPVLELRSYSLTTSAQFSPDGSRIVTTGSGARIWDPVTGAELLELSGAPSTVMFSPDGTRLLGIGMDQVLTIWDSQPLDPDSIPSPRAKP
jgi:WD40 repeat protein